MGGGHYDGDVAERQRSTRREVFTYRGQTVDTGRASRGPQRKEVHSLLNIKGKIRECCDSDEHPDTTPIGIVLDVTRSRGEDAKVIYGKFPMFIGQMYMRGYVPHPTVCFAAVGDASSGDQAPVQVSQWESDNRLDEALSKVWLEGRGGGTGEESYELLAYYFARGMKIDANKRGKKGILFFLGDESPYLKVAKDQVKVWIGHDIPDDIPTANIFEELQQRFDVFFIFPKKSAAERQDDIDAEIKQRVEAAGGQYQDVDFRASLIWGNRNDLDLHVITPSGHHIYYGDKRSPCGGWLDVDMNVRGETTKPVENTRWKKGQAPQGEYKVFVRNYAFHEDSYAATPFRVEVEVNGQIQHFEGQTPDHTTGLTSDQHIGEFLFDPSDRAGEVNTEEVRAKYDNAFVRANWAKLIPPEHILELEDPRAIVDAMLGVVAINNGARDLKDYLADMVERDQTPERCAQIKETLEPFASTMTTQKVAADVFKSRGTSRKKGGSMRI